MMAILFYVGQGLEKPSVVSEMLDMSIYPTKPNYDMTADRPLILWDCVFPEDKLKWLPAEGVRCGPTQRDALVDTVWGEWKRTKMEELQWGMLLDKVAEQSPKVHNGDKRQSQIIVSGGVDVKPRGQYKPIRMRERMRDVDEINRAWVEKNGEIRMNNAKGRAKRKAAEVEGNGA
jgi:tRNA pseudouridine38/39 synthase